MDVGVGNATEEKVDEFNIQKKKSPVASIISGLMIVVCLGVLGFVGYKFITNPSNETEKAMRTPEMALAHYVKMSSRFNRDPVKTPMGDVLACFTREDRKWFEANHEKIAYDFLNMNSALDPSIADMKSRMEALSYVLGRAPWSEDYKIVKQKVESKRAIFRINYAGQWSRSTTDIKLVKQGPAWKVVDLGGAKTALLGRGGGTSSSSTAVE